MVEKFRDEFEAAIAEAGSSRSCLSARTSPSSSTGSRWRRRGGDARRRRQARRRRDPGLLLRAEAGPSGRRLPHVHGRGRGDPEAADRLLDPGARRDGRLHADRPREGGAERRGRVPARQPPARLPGLRQGRRVPAPGHRDGLGAGPQPDRPTPSATSRSRSRSRRWSRSTASAASSATAACASARRWPRTSSYSCWSAGPSTFVGTFDDRPYIAPFHGNIIELCPVGALTSEAYRFRARPWDIEDAGSVCTLCPSQCNVKLHGPRRARSSACWPATTHEVDDGWLCDKGRFGFQMIASPERITEPMVRAGGDAAPGELGGGARGGRGGPARGRRRGRGDRRRRHLERGGLPDPADRPRGARLAARGLARGRRPPTASLAGRPLAPRAGGARSGRHRRGRVDPRGRHRPAPADADPRPADPQGDAPLAAPASRSPPSARPRSTAAPRRPPATRPARRPPSCAALAGRARARRADAGPRLGRGRARSPASCSPGSTVIVCGRAARTRPGRRRRARRPARLRARARRRRTAPA